MQATVALFDDGDGSGLVVLDDGTRLGFAGDALVGSGLRRLRPGQRVRVLRGDSGEIRLLTLLTFEADQ